MKTENMSMKRPILILITVLLLTQFAAAQQRASTNIEVQLVNTDPFPVEAGDDADIRLAVRNTGSSEARNVEVTIQDSFPFQVKPDRQQVYDIGSITPGEKYHISTEVLVAENAPDGMNDLKVEIDTGQVTQTVNVPVEVASQDVELNLANVQTTPSDLKPDTEDNQMSLDVVNNGDDTAENVVMDIQLPDSFEPVSSLSTRQSLGNIGPGETKTATFSFDINESAGKGRVTVPAEIRYSKNDSSSQKAIDRSIGLYLSGAPRYEVVNVESDLQASERRQLRVTVKNTGSDESTSTRIRVLDNADLPFSYDSSSSFIGTLQPGESGTAVFDIRTEQGAPAKNYLVDFEIRGVKDTEVFVEDTTLDLPVQASQQANTSQNLIILAAVVLLLAAGGIYYFRDRLF